MSADNTTALKALARGPKMKLALGARAYSWLMINGYGEEFSARSEHPKHKTMEGWRGQEVPWLRITEKGREALAEMGA